LSVSLAGLACIFFTRRICARPLLTSKHECPETASNRHTDIAGASLLVLWALPAWWLDADNAWAARTMAGMFRGWLGRESFTFTKNCKVCKSVEPIWSINSFTFHPSFGLFCSTWTCNSEKAFFVM
jgi:hypothetical protein